MSTTVDYTNIASIKEHWMNNIAPSYYDFNNLNNYHSGQFGLFTEIMAESVEDVFQAMVAIRREFYPTTMVYQSTVYKTAPLHRLDAPMAVPATAACLLLLEQKEVMDRSTFEGGIYKFILDDTMTIIAGEIPFMIDYPIIILSKRIENGYSVTSHYDVTVNNSLAASNQDKYIPTIQMKANGVNYLVLSLNVRQCTKETKNLPVQKDVMLNTVTLDVDFEGTLANFELFYMESDTSEEIHLEKVLKNRPAITKPFCFYEMITTNKIRLTFTKNAHFTPLFGSTVRVEIYTTLGQDGNFDICKSDLICQMKSSSHPNNNTMTITGKINGASSGGENASNLEDFKAEVQEAYATNKTLTTANDIQTYFNTIKNTYRELEKLKVVFRKIRDDAFIRLWGAHVLMKDASDNVIPTNTVEFRVHSNDVLSDERSETNYYILPGTLLTYEPDKDDTRIYRCTYLSGSVIDDMDELEKENECVFTSPFLINVSLQQSLVGFFLNSINSKLSLAYTYVNDLSYMQFIAYNMFIYRNAMLGENFYTVSVEIMPASELDVATVLEIDEEPVEIRASKDGYYAGCTFDGDRVTAKFVYEDKTEEIVYVNSYTNKDLDFVIESGYDIQLNIGEKFLEGNVLAIRKPKDLGKIRGVMDFTKVLIANQYYIPMYIEAYDESTKSYTLRGYFGTTDEITLESNVNISNGIYTAEGEHDKNVSIPMINLTPQFHICYDDDTTNYAHSMPEIQYIKGYTLANTYTMNTDLHGRLNIIQQIDYIRSNIIFTPGSNQAEDARDYYLNIDEVPVLRAKWAKIRSNFEFFVTQIRSAYKILQIIYLLLENDFGIDMKFYNTYGKARFFKIGIKGERKILDAVNCSMYFGVYLNSISNSDTVLTKIRSFIKEYIESFNSSASKGQSIYIMSLIAACQKEFSEIAFMEWYGINDYDYGIQTIESLSDLEIMDNGIVDYIPEFININSKTLTNGVSIPDIQLKVLNPEAV